MISGSSRPIFELTREREWSFLQAPDRCSSFPSLPSTSRHPSAQHDESPYVSADSLLFSVSLSAHHTKGTGVSLNTGLVQRSCLSPCSGKKKQILPRSEHFQVEPPRKLLGGKHPVKPVTLICLSTSYTVISDIIKLLWSCDILQHYKSGYKIIYSFINAFPTARGGQFQYRAGVTWVDSWIRKKGSENEQKRQKEIENKTFWRRQIDSSACLMMKGLFFSSFQDVRLPPSVCSSHQRTDNRQTTPVKSEQSYKNNKQSK